MGASHRSTRRPRPTTPATALGGGPWKVVPVAATCACVIRSPSLPVTGSCGAARRRGARKGDAVRGVPNAPAPGVRMAASGAPETAPIQRPLERPAGPAALHGPAGKSGRWANFIAAGAHAQSGLAEKSAVAAGFVPTRAERSRVTGPAKAATRGERSHVLSPLALPVPHACRFRDTLALTTVAH